MTKGKRLSDLFAGFVNKFKLRKAPLKNEWGADQVVSSQSFSVAIARQHFVFGLAWQLFSDAKEFGKLLRASQAQGYTHYVRARSGDMVGFAAGLNKSMGPEPISAAVHLADSVSLGGVEVFVFELSAGLCSLIALNESQPIPQFEQVGSSQEVKSWVSEFRALQSDQPIRYVGNVEWYENTEQMSLNEVFARPDAVSNLLRLPNFRLRQLLASILIPAGLVTAGGAAWVIHAREAEQQERMAREQDPNFIYENAVGSAMQQTGLQAQIMLERWREVVFRVPTTRAGWNLEKIMCQPTNCAVTWKRDFGSYRDFHTDPLEGTISASETQNGDGPAQADITTVLTVPTLPGEAKGLVRAQLPDLRSALREFASQLQDISLVPGADVKLKKPELYPATGASIEQITNPVAKGEWVITHELWTLGDLSFDLPNLVLQNLSITKDDKSKDWTYTLTGNYYARGKNN